MITIHLYNMMIIIFAGKKNNNKKQQQLLHRSRDFEITWHKYSQ
jgi:hypothetical protein